MNTVIRRKDKKPKNDKKSKKKRVSSNIVTSKPSTNKVPSAKPADFYIFERSGSPKDDKTTLQEAFCKFRDVRQAEILSSNASQASFLQNPQRMLKLRKKFLKQCKSYMGVPYRKKYHQPGTAAYNSSIFLDCCGLVRRALRDLSKDFGFRVGPWNQAYMFDTLPIVVENEQDMKPGDLVFISAVYFNEKMRRQPHDMVHVEVWLGDGHKTIGARWHKGRVQVFDSYKFESTSYHSMEYHFRSIDTWLQGNCVSHCQRHPWKRSDHFKPSKRSIFFSNRLNPTAQSDPRCEVTNEGSDGEDASDNEEARPGASMFVEGISTAGGNEESMPQNANNEAQIISFNQEIPRPPVTTLDSAVVAQTEAESTQISFQSSSVVQCSLPAPVMTSELTQTTSSPDQSSQESSASDELQAVDGANTPVHSVLNLRKPMYFFTTKRIHPGGCSDSEPSRDLASSVEELLHHAEDLNASETDQVTACVANTVMQRALTELVSDQSNK